MRLSDIAEYLGAELCGNPDIEINGVCKIDQGEDAKITFLANPKYSHFLDETKASAVLVSPDFSTNSKIPLLKIKNPYYAYVRIVSQFYTLAQPFKGIHPSVVIENSAKIGENAAIAPNVYIGKNVHIGKNAVIYPNTVIMDDVHIADDFRSYSNVSIREESKIGNRVCIHAGAVIGADGFGFAPNPPDGFEKIYQIGRVVLEDDVEIGANTCVDRAAIGDTIIGKGTKLDNLVQIGHGVEIGQHNVLAALTGVAGSTKMGHWNQVGGCNAISGHLTIGNQNNIAANSLVRNNLADGETVMGVPHRDGASFKRIFASEAKLPQLIKDIRTLKKEVETLKDQLNKK